MMVRKREDEVLDIIKADPLISQKEIAEKLGITRSSVGVHVNNLTKKGKIIGRGYVLSKVNKVCVIGGSNIDVWGFSDGPLKKGSSNIGDVNISVGGVSRNIAESLTKLGIQTEFITAISNDEYGKHIYSYCLKEGVRIDRANIFKNQRTSFFLSIVDKETHEKYAVADMSIMDQITPAHINQRRAEINNCNLIVLDLNTPKNTVEFILSNFKNKLIMIDPVSVSKVEKIEKLLDLVKFIKLNRVELQELSGMPVDTPEDVKKAAKSLIEKGIKEIVVSNDFNAICYASKDDYFRLESKHKEIESKEVEFKQGIREAQFAGLVYGKFNNLTVEESLNIAMKAGELTAETDELVSPWLSVENIYERLENE